MVIRRDWSTDRVGVRRMRERDFMRLCGGRVRAERPDSIRKGDPWIVNPRGQTPSGEMAQLPLSLSTNPRMIQTSLRPGNCARVTLCTLWFLTHVAASLTCKGNSKLSMTAACSHWTWTKADIPPRRSAATWVVVSSSPGQRIERPTSQVLEP